MQTEVKRQSLPNNVFRPSFIEEGKQIVPRGTQKVDFVEIREKIKYLDNYIKDSNEKIKFFRDRTPNNRPADQQTTSSKISKRSQCSSKTERASIQSCKIEDILDKSNNYVEKQSENIESLKRRNTNKLMNANTVSSQNNLNSKSIKQITLEIENIKRQEIELLQLNTEIIIQQYNEIKFKLKEEYEKKLASIECEIKVKFDQLHSESEYKIKEQIHNLYNEIQSAFTATLGELSRNKPLDEKVFSQKNKKLPFAAEMVLSYSPNKHSPSKLINLKKANFKQIPKESSRKQSNTQSNIAKISNGTDKEVLKMYDNYTLEFSNIISNKAIGLWDINSTSPIQSAKQDGR